ncbi:GlcG/HbpS family heme-binding protein [Vibrio astriarenae]
MTFKLTLLTSTLLLSAYSQASVCDALPTYDALTKALKSSVATTSEEKNGGLELNMWGSIVARDGTVCAVSRTGNHFGDQWPGSRIISAQKANTANSFSLPGLALSTANLWAPTQPGGSLFGLQFSNPVNINVVYDGDAENYGTKEDSMIGHRVGGVNVFGGGLALYDKDGEILGAIGVSGDTSCADHNIAWKTRHALKLDYVPGGVSETSDDNIIYTEGHGFGHVSCGNGEAAIAMKLPEMYPVSK